MRVVAIDYGLVRIGVAITDNSKLIAYPFKTIQTAKNFENTSQAILDALKEHLDEIETIIIGLPLLLKGSLSQMATEIQKFVEVLKTKTKIPIKFLDERLTSVMAERHLKDNLKLNRKKRSKIIDPIAATMLLQDYIQT